MQKQTVYITKYFLTKGIIKAKGDYTPDRGFGHNVNAKIGKYGYQYFIEGEFYLTEIEAVGNALKMKDKELKRLRAKLAKLESLELPFKITEI